MKYRVLAVVSGWLLSTFVQVPGPVQTGLKSAASWILDTIAAKWSSYRKTQTATELSGRFRSGSDS